MSRAAISQVMRGVRSSPGGLTLRVSAAALVAAVVVALLVGLLLDSIANLRSASGEAGRAQQALTSLERVQQVALDMETGVRGYVITGRSSFLAPYQQARRLIVPASTDLLARLSGDPAQRARARALALDLRAYDRDYASPEIALVRTSPASARTVAATAEGKRRVDSIRSQVNAILVVLSARQAQRQRGAQASADHATAEGYVVLIVLVSLVIALGLALHRLVVAPLRRVAQAVEKLERGDLAARATDAGGGEVGLLGEAINRLAASLHHSRAELEQRNAELSQVADRNLVLLDAVYTQTPVGLAFLDCDLRFARVNDALAVQDGHSVTEHIGRTPQDVAPEAAAGYMPLLREVLDSRQAIVQRPLRIDLPGSPVWMLDVYPVRQGAALLGLGLVVVDISERARLTSEREALLRSEREAHQRSERERRRASFLAEASAVLDASLDFDETLAAFARLSVPGIADWCTVDILGSEGQLQTVAVAHVDPDEVARMHRLSGGQAEPLSASPAAERVLRSGRAELHESISEDVLRESEIAAEHAATVRQLRVTSAMIVPMIVRGRPLGAITFLAAAGDRHFTEGDFLEAQELGRRAALAVDTARLYQQRAETARVLQMSLLPQRLPAIEGFELAARFHAAGEGALVGGDFYDAFPTGSGTWAIMVGDVCGKGAEAAAVTGMARYTLRARSRAGLSPSQALAALNESMLAQQEDHRFVTMVYVELDLRHGRPRLRVACAGHPAPIVVRATGEASALDTRGTLLGIVTDVSFHETRLTLAEGDALVLYSDGVTEAERSDMYSADQVAQRIGPVHSADALAAAVEGIAFRAPGALLDDVAIVAMRYAPAGAPAAARDAPAPAAGVAPGPGAPGLRGDA